MSYYRGHKRRRLSGTAILVIIIGAVFVYAGILLGIKAVGNRLEGKDTAAEPVGSLEGRFDSDDLTMQYAGRTWTYRERDLTNILLLGVDWSDASDAESIRYAGQADFIFLITVDKANKTVSTLQIDRDTMTDIRIYGPFGDYTGTKELQICLSHAYGSTADENCRNTAWAVSHLLGGIPVDKYIALDMGAIAALNDALGGVTVTLEDDFSAIDPQMTKGTTLTLQGMQAEYYVRGRQGVGDGTNVSRMRRQRTFILQAEEMLSQGMSTDMNYAGTLFDALADHMTTNIERGWLINKAYESREYTRPSTQTPAGSHTIGTDGYVEFYPDQDALSALLTTLFFE